MQPHLFGGDLPVAQQFFSVVSTTDILIPVFSDRVDVGDIIPALVVRPQRGQVVDHCRTPASDADQLALASVAPEGSPCDRQRGCEL